MGKKKIAGIILCVGVAQAILAILIAQSLYPNYSVLQYLSDLGVGTTAPIFNISIILLGISFILSAYFLKDVLKSRIFVIFLAITGIFAMGVGLFPETTGALHIYIALLSFSCGAVAVLLSSRLVESPSNYLYVVLGIISALFLILGLLGYSFGLGIGGMERMVVYPLLIWGLCFGGYLLAQKN